MGPGDRDGGPRGETLDVFLPNTPTGLTRRVKTDRVTFDYLLPAILQARRELLIPASWLARHGATLRKRLATVAVLGTLGAACLSALSLSLLPIDECDLLAAGSADAFRIGPGNDHIALQIFHSRRATLACEQAISRDGTNGRFRYQLARAVGGHDPKRAHDEALRAARLGYPAAFNFVGVDFLNGEGVMKDLDQAEHHISRAVEMGNFESLFNLADVARRRGDSRKAFELLTRYVQGGGDKVYSLAVFYRDGIEVPQDEAKYLELLRIGISRQDGSSAAALAYQYGEGVLRDESGSRERENELNGQAIRWEADSTASSNLANNYRLGRGIEQSNERATYWHIFAAKQGSTSALRLLSEMILAGEAVFANGYGPPDDFNGQTLLLTAAQAGDADAQNKYAEWLEGRADGETDTSLANALEWYRKAASQGHEGAADALKRLGTDTAGALGAASKSSDAR